MTTLISMIDARGFSKVAHRLGTTKSRVSQRIQQPKRRLGRMLLNRARSLGLTDPSRTYYERVCRLLQELEQVEMSMLGADDDLYGQLRLSVPLVFTPRYLVLLLARFAEHHPQLRVDVQVDDRLVNLQEPRFNITLCTGRLDDFCLVTRPIATNHHLLCASPGYLVRHGVPQHPEELRAYDGLVYCNREPGSMLCLPVDGEPASFRIRVRMRTDSGHQLLEGARARLGLAIPSNFLAAETLLADELLPVLPGYSPDDRQVSVVCRKTQRTPREILILGQFLEEEISDPAPWGRALTERGLLPLG